MAKDIDGVNFQRDGKYAICHIEYLSDEIKELIRSNLPTICHGSHVTDYGNAPLFSYKTTLKSFLERYVSKDKNTQKGMVGIVDPDFQTIN